MANLKRCSLCKYVEVHDCYLFCGKNQCLTDEDDICNEFELLSVEDKYGYYKCNSCGATGCSSASGRCGHCGSVDIELTKFVSDEESDYARLKRKFFPEECEK